MSIAFSAFCLDITICERILPFCFMNWSVQTDGGRMRRLSAWSAMANFSGLIEMCRVIVLQHEDFHASQDSIMLCDCTAGIASLVQAPFYNQHYVQTLSAEQNQQTCLQKCFVAPYSRCWLNPDSRHYFTLLYSMKCPKATSLAFHQMAKYLPL